MQKDLTPNWGGEVIDAEVIEAEPANKVAYKPKIKPIIEKAKKTGELTPVVNNMQVQGFGKDEIKAVVTEVTVSSALRTAMAAPNSTYSVGDEILNNAQAIGKVLIEKAVAGDMQAIREVLNRTEGKVPNVNRNANMSVNVKGDANSLAALMGKIDANKS